MANSKLAVARDVVGGTMMGLKIHQAIWNIQVSTTPTTARIKFAIMFDTVPFVTVYQDGVQIRGWWAVPDASGNYRVTFSGLPQDTELGFMIAVADPRPPSWQLPGGIVTYSGILETGLRTATVRLNRLKELQGEAEITFRTRLYDWNGDSGTPITSVLQYGRGHMDPDGSPIGDPFGTPSLLAQAPDAIALYTEAWIDTSSFLSDAVNFVTDPGLKVVGWGPLDRFPNDAPSHVVYNSDVAKTTAQAIVNLPRNEGPFNIPFSYASDLFDYAFQIDGSIDGHVYKFNHPTTRSLSFHPRHLAFSVAVPHSPHATVLANDTLLHFHVTVDGHVQRLRGDARTSADLERLGDVAAEWLLAAGRQDGHADLLALRRDGTVLHARAGKRDTVSWQELGAKLAGQPAVTRSPDGASHLFGLDEAGTLLHAVIGSRARNAPRWDRWGRGLAGRLSCACNAKGEAHLFARQDGRIAHGRLALRGGDSKPPHWDTMATPFSGPVTVATTEDGKFAALGCDDNQVFWLKTWEGGRSQPDGSRWKRMGTLDDLFPAAQKSRAERTAERGQP